MKNKLGNFNVRNTVLAGVFISLAIIFTRLLSVDVTAAIRVGLGEIPVMIGGMMLGPIYGVAIGGLSDLIGFAIKPGGLYFPGFTLTSMVVGLLGGLYNIFIIKKYGFQIIAILIYCIISIIISTVFMNTLWLSILYGIDFQIILPMRLVKAVISLLIYPFIVFLVFRAKPIRDMVQQL